MYTAQWRRNDDAVRNYITQRARCLTKLQTTLPLQSQWVQQKIHLHQDVSISLQKQWIRAQRIRCEQQGWKISVTVGASLPPRKWSSPTPQYTHKVELFFPSTRNKTGRVPQHWLRQPLLPGRFPLKFFSSQLMRILLALAKRGCCCSIFKPLLWKNLI